MAAETTHTLKIKADTRAVKVLGQEIQKAFDTRKPREYQRELSGMQRRLKDLSAAQTHLVKELEKTKEGTDAFKKLQDQLKLVGREAKTVQGAVSSLTTAYKDFNAERKRGFAAGMAQGLGISDYIPSEPGMGRRIAGAMVGRGVRRAYGAAMAPIQQPGVGGLATMLGAIPGIGPMVSGQIQALSGMYQQAVAYQQSARGALFAQGAGFTPAQQKARIVQGELEVAKERQREKLMLGAAKHFRDREKASTEAKEKIAGGARRAVAAAAPMGGGWAGLAAGLRAERERIRAATAEEKEAAGMAPGEALKPPPGGRRYPHAEYTDPSLIRMKAKQRIEEIRSRARAQPTGLPGMHEGVSFGFGPNEMMQQFTQFMQARGGTYDDVKTRAFRQQLAATTMGVSAGQAGQFARMGAAGGGGRGAVDLATMLSSAVTVGMRGSQIPEYLQTLVSLGQEAERSGVKIDERAFTRQAGLLQAVGFKGPQIGRVATGVNRAAMQLSQRGVSSPVDMIMLRAAGYDPSQGPEGYASAINKIEGGMDLPMLQRLLGMATQGATGGVGATGRQTSILMMKRFFSRMGTPMSAASASGILDAYQEGKLGREHVSMLNRNISSTERKDAHGWLVGGAKRAIARGAPVAVAEAGMEAKRVALGMKVSGTMEKLNEASIHAAGAVAAFDSQLKYLATGMANLTRKLEAFSKALAGGGGWNAVVGLAKSLAE